MRRLLEFLSLNDLPLSLALRLYRHYGAEALDAVRRNPYLLVDELYGVDFAVMDEIALSMGMAGDSRRRIEAAVLFELTYNLNNGHVFLPGTSSSPPPPSSLTALRTWWRRPWTTSLSGAPSAASG